MSDDRNTDFYDLLQVSPNADPETIHRVYRLLAQRFHPDNKETGHDGRFRAIQEAYDVLSHPEKRAQYDVVYQRLRRDRWRLVSNGARSENDFDIEQLVRITLLEVLYTRRRMEPGNPGVYSPDLEELIGRPREHLEFTIWYLVQKKLLLRDDNSRLTITADGVDYLEKNYEVNLQRKRLAAAAGPSR